MSSRRPLPDQRVDYSELVWQVSCVCSPVWLARARRRRDADLVADSHNERGDGHHARVDYVDTTRGGTHA